MSDVSLTSVPLSNERDDEREPATLTGEATQRIRQLILDGEMEPHCRINEVQLSTALAISRTPLRAALQTLAGEGLLIYNANRGFTVRGFDLAEVIDAYTMRSLAEGLAARLAAERGVPAPEKKALQDALDAGELALAEGLTSEERQARYATSNLQFHAAIHRAPGTHILPGVLGFCRIPQVSASRVLALSLEDIRTRQAAHREIFNAIMCREADRAEALMRTHVLAVKATMIAALTRWR